MTEAVAEKPAENIKGIAIEYLYEGRRLNDKDERKLRGIVESISDAKNVFSTIVVGSWDSAYLGVFLVRRLCDELFIGEARAKLWALDYENHLGGIEFDINHEIGHIKIGNVQRRAHTLAILYAFAKSDDAVEDYSQSIATLATLDLGSAVSRVPSQDTQDQERLLIHDAMHRDGALTFLRRETEVEVKDRAFTVLQEIKRSITNKA